MVEVRIPQVAGRSNRTDSGYFDDISKLAQVVVSNYDDGTPGIYVTLNPVNPALKARAANRIKSWARNTTSDSDILRRRWLPIDIDPVRPSGISSTDEEHEAALAVAKKIRDWLADIGWPEPILADSGNGAHLLYRIDLLNDHESTLLVQQCLEAIAFEWNDEMVTIDVGNYNAARIWKLYGTKVQKGDHTRKHPHRWSYVVEAPDDVGTVPLQRLKDLSNRRPLITPQSSDGFAGQKNSFDLESWLQRNGLHGRKQRLQDGWLWRLDDCPFSDDHSDGAYVGQLANGALYAGCHHNRCPHRTWRDLFDGANERKKHNVVRFSPPRQGESNDEESLVTALNLDSHGLRKPK